MILMEPIRPIPAGSGRIDGNSAGSDWIEIGAVLQSLIRPLTNRETINYIGEFFEDGICSLNTQATFPSRSCDLTTCDFFLWPYLKNSIFETPLGDKEDLQRKYRKSTHHIE
ncbi:hypothetical protein NQ318_004611 [Aromia moschata]|uniref:Uncharacterized protein n=1 Tax=Aromia moschata TaxID=1265417 RepID=A0AAV8X1A6_9CUCU|nr:hypothetical protein NQ318_004611 [Aromia moschata]